MLEGNRICTTKPQEQSLGEPSGTATPNSTLGRVLRGVMELLKLFFPLLLDYFFVKININLRGGREKEIDVSPQL